MIGCKIDQLGYEATFCVYQLLREYYNDPNIINMVNYQDLLSLALIRRWQFEEVRDKNGLMTECNGIIHNIKLIVDYMETHRW